MNNIRPQTTGNMSRQHALNGGQAQNQSNYRLGKSSNLFSLVVILKRNTASNLANFAFEMAISYSLTSFVLCRSKHSICEHDKKRKSQVC